MLHPMFLFEMLLYRLIDFLLCAFFPVLFLVIQVIHFAVKKKSSGVLDVITILVSGSYYYFFISRSFAPPQNEEVATGHDLLFEELSLTGREIPDAILFWLFVVSLFSLLVLCITAPEKLSAAGKHILWILTGIGVVLQALWFSMFFFLWQDGFFWQVDGDFLIYTAPYHLVHLYVTGIQTVRYLKKTGNIYQKERMTS